MYHRTPFQKDIIYFSNIRRKFESISGFAYSILFLQQNLRPKSLRNMSIEKLQNFLLSEQNIENNYNMYKQSRHG